MRVVELIREDIEVSPIGFLVLLRSRLAKACGVVVVDVVVSLELFIRVVQVDSLERSGYILGF